MQDTKSISAFYHLEMTSFHPTYLPDFCMLPVSIIPLLQCFSHLFQEPQGLPPVRNISHQIQLLPDSAPVNMRLYWHRHFQKKQMELLQEILSTGIVWHNNSSFSSLVLVVKKETGIGALASIIGL